MCAPDVATVGLAGWSLIAAATIAPVRQPGQLRMAVRAKGGRLAAISVMFLEWEAGCRH